MLTILPNSGPREVIQVIGNQPYDWQTYKLGFWLRSYFLAHWATLSFVFIFYIRDFCPLPFTKYQSIHYLPAWLFYLDNRLLGGKSHSMSTVTFPIPSTMATHWDTRSMYMYSQREWGHMLPAPSIWHVANGGTLLGRPETFLCLFRSRGPSSLYDV